MLSFERKADGQPATAESQQQLPLLIQGGMGAAISSWRLASAVSRAGHLGVISGTALAVVLARTLQDGDRGGHVRRALAAFPDQQIAEQIVDRYFLEAGRAPDRPYRSVPVPRVPPGRHFQELTIAGCFVEVHLAKEGHDGLIGMNLLEKIQIPTLPALYGAMLAGVDLVLMGAGIPYHIPAALNALSERRGCTLPIPVEGAEEPYTLSFDPAAIIPSAPQRLRRPGFLAIVGSHVLATQLAREQYSRPDGFVVERPVAGGHNAPPRGPMRLDPDGEPIYGPRDEADFERLRALGIPFWVAGGYGHPEKLKDALAEGAVGIQVGSAFALCEESGFHPELRRIAREAAAAGTIEVRTDPVASPTGFPFKVAQVAGTIAEQAVFEARQRRCDVSYLTTLYRRPNGKIGYRCPSEPIDDYLAKGGRIEDTVGRACLCNGLIAAAAQPQRMAAGGDEPALMTLGDDAPAVVRAISPQGLPYHAADVIEYLLGERSERPAQQGERTAHGDPRETAAGGILAGLFPGQGSQVAGMAELVQSIAPELHARCLELVGDDPFARVAESTRFAQPAIYCASIAGWLRLRDQLRPALYAGHSLGEISALVAAGAIDARSGLELAVRRGELMAQAEAGEREGMLALLGGEFEQCEQLAAAHGLALANHNAPGQVVLSGAIASLRQARTQAREQGLRAIMLDVAGAFHSPSMTVAVQPFRELLDQIRIAQPVVPVISAASAKPFADIRAELAESIVRPVLWHDCMLALGRLGAERFIDFGPGRVLARLVGRNLPEAACIDNESPPTPAGKEVAGVA